MEIHASNEPIALIISAGEIKPHKIVARGNYFVVNDKKVRGIYTINKKYRLNWGKTTCYVYSVQEMNPVDPLIVSELNQFIRTNKLSQLRIKDVQHGSRLRSLMARRNKNDSINFLEKQEETKAEKMDKEINEANAKINEAIEFQREKRGKDFEPSQENRSFILLNHLKETKVIDEKEHARLLQMIENRELTFPTLIDELRQFHVINVVEPLDVSVEDFILDLGSQNPRELAGLVQDLRANKRGLADMTAKPVKSFLSAGIILAIGLVIIIGIAVLPSALPSITHAAGGKGGFDLNPFDIFKGHFLLGAEKILSWFR